MSENIKVFMENKVGKTYYFDELILIDILRTRLKNDKITLEEANKAWKHRR